MFAFRRRRWSILVAGAALVVGPLAAFGFQPVGIGTTPAGAATPKGDFSRVVGKVAAHGELDCNGFSPVQRPIRQFNCTDIRGWAGVSNQNVWDDRFFDNGHYIGHDEPDVTFLSNKPGSGNNVTWNMTLGSDPSAAPTAADPGHDVSNWFELSPAPWFSMAMCDPNSYPQLPCTPESDSNAPACPTGLGCPSDVYPGGGSAFMELQFYPPGNAPFYDSESCNNTSWCAALTIDSLECGVLATSCNTACEEPINFAFVQTDGVPDPVGGGYVPDKNTLLMKPGDRVSVQMYDAPVPGEAGQKAFRVVITDSTTGATGSMQASDKNGFVTTSMADCAQSPFNFQPEYNTASVGNYIPWAALQTNISTEFETGHFEPCTKVVDEFPNNDATSLGSNLGPNPIDEYDTGGTYNECQGPYETAGGGDENPTSPTPGAEVSDGLCYKAGDKHTGYIPPTGGSGTGTGSSDPDLVTGCQDNYEQNGDLDFDGTPYYGGEWPTSATIDPATSRVPSSFVESLPTTANTEYPRMFFQTDVALSEYGTGCGTTTAGCTVPPSGPGKFYPYWTEVDHGGTCTLEFGNVNAANSAMDDFGKDAQYGTNQVEKIGYPEFESEILDNTCFPRLSEGYVTVDKSGAVASAGDVVPPMANVHTPQGSVVDMAGTPDGRGYFAVTDTGAVYTSGNANFRGDLTTLSPPVRVSNIVAIAPTVDGGGYWLIGADGGIFAFGDARYHGSIPGLGKRVTDVVGMVATPSGSGYIIVGADGGVFVFGLGHYFGSLPGLGIRVRDIRSILSSPADTGYVLVGADGGAFVFGSGTPFHGSLPGEGIRVDDIVGIALTADGGGYWMAGSNGSVYPFGNARPLPSNLSSSDLPVTSIAGMAVANAD